MPKHPSLLQQFRSFCYQNNTTDFEKAIEYFAVFGGMGWAVDFTQDLDNLIEQKILKNYRYIHGDLTKITHSKPHYHAILTAIARGDRREHAAFKRANIGREQGEEIIDFLIQDGFVYFDTSVEKPIHATDSISDKLLFVTPFMRFWFAMVSPTYKSIKRGDYSEFKQQWQKTKSTFSHLLYHQLILELLQHTLKERFEGNPIVGIGSYYDRYVEIDILIKQKSGAYLAGSCRYGDSKSNKSELTKLKASCKQASLDVETFILFSKQKFSSELKKQQGDRLHLFSTRHLAKLIENLSKQDLIATTNKKY